jgi:hypothetical protein
MRLLLGLFFTTFAVVAACQPAEADGYEALYELFWQSAPIDWSHLDWSHCDIVQTLNFDQYELRMGEIRDSWLYKDKSVEYYQRRGNQILYVVGRKYATVLTQATYMHSDAQSCRFRLFVTELDEFGNDRRYLLLSWRFTRQLADKTHLDQLDDRKFPSLAPDFRWGQEFETLVREELRLFPPPTD